MNSVSVQPRGMCNATLIAQLDYIRAGLHHVDALTTEARNRSRVLRGATGRQNGSQSRRREVDLLKDNQLKVLTIDPGETSGYAHGIISKGEMVIATGQNKWTGLELLDHVKWFDPDIILYETFDFRRSPKAQRDRVNLYAKELIGVIKLHAEIEDKVDLQTQTPAQVMGKIAYFNHGRLKSIGIYKPGMKHANEAVRHLLYWFEFGQGYKYNKKGYKVAV